MRAVVTGGAGFIGSHVVDALLARGDEVHVVDNLATGRRENVHDGGDAARARHPGAARRALRRVAPEVVFHLAAQADVGTSVERPVFDAEVNVLGTVNVLEAARPHGAQVVFTSTGGAIYGECERPAREDDPRASRSRRTAPSKLAAEEYLATWNRLHGTRHVVAPLRERLRPAAAPEARGRRRRDLPRPAALGRGHAPIFGDGEQTRDFVYVGDVVAAVLAAIGQRRRRLQRRHRHRDVRERAVRRLPHGSRASRSRPSMRRRGPATRCGASSTSRVRSGSSAGGRRRRSTEGSARPGASGLSGLPRRSSRFASPSGSCAAATLIWAPAPDRRLIGSAYGPASDFLFRTFAQWDARWFLQIAEHGYEEVPQAAAFFPVYPAAAHALAWVTGSTLVAGVLISLAAGAVAAWALAEIARPILGGRGANDVVLYLALYPVGFVFTALYSDGLFLALAAGSFLAATRGKAVTAGVLGGLATGTRLLGLALAAGTRRAALARARPRSLSRLVPAAAPAGRGRSLRALSQLDARRPLGVHQRPGRLGSRRVAARPARGTARRRPRRRTGCARSARPPGRGPGPRRARRALEPLPSRAARRGRWLTWVAWRRLGPAFGLYSVATLAILLSVPAEGFPLVSLPRFLLGDFPLFLALASLTLDHPRARGPTLCTFAALGAVAAAAFARGIWVA